MTKRREMIDDNTSRDHIEYVMICKTVKKKEGRYNLDGIRETIEASRA